MIRFFEELSLNSWPALQTHHYDGWVLRFADGYTRRSNSVSPLYPSTLPPLEKIAYCEQVYTGRGLDTVFKVTNDAQPSTLDSLLAEQGYMLNALTSVQTLNLASLAAPSIHTIDVTSQLEENWLEDYCRLNEREIIPAMRRVLENIPLPRAFVTLYHDGQAAATGLGVIERGYIGLYDIVVASPFRNRGVGYQLMLNLLQWGKANGAHHVYLNVMCDNVAALRLYAKLGFQELYRYWYRVKAHS